MSGFSNYLEAAIINSTLRGVAFTVPAAVYVALHTADPGDAGATAEASYSGYARQNTTGGWAAPAGNDAESLNTAQINFPPNASASSQVMTHFSIWDAVTGGNCLYIGALAAAKTITPGDQPSFAAGALSVKPDTA